MEAGVALPDRLVAAEFLKRTYARQVVEGSVSAREGAARIVELLHELEPDLSTRGRFLGDAFGVSVVVGAYYGLDDAGDNGCLHVRALGSIR